LLSDSDRSIKLGGSEIYWFGSDERELLDVLAEVVWQACSGKHQMEPDTLSWLSKAIGKSKQSRYAGVVDSCLAADIDKGTRKYMRSALKELTVASGDVFQGGLLDLSRIRAGLSHPRTGAPKILAESFNQLHLDTPLAEIYSLLGYPDEVGVGVVTANNRINRRAWTSALVLTYRGLGEIHLYAEEGGNDWKLDNAVNSNGLLKSSFDGRFATTTDLIAHGNMLQLREIADYLISRKSLSNDEFEAIMSRVKVPAESDDEKLVDALEWLARAALESGNAAFERKMTMRLIEHGDGLQLRHLAGHWLDKEAQDGEVLEAMMARIKSSQDTNDAMLADGLAYVCKVIQKSGNAKYKAPMTEISNTATHRSLRKYARQAAEAL
jgi:hypothetical protein